MQQNNIAETLIGAVVVTVAVAFLVFGYYRTGSGSLSGYEVNAKLAKVDGLSVGTDVRLAGIKIGSVTALDLDPKTYLATVQCHRDFGRRGGRRRGLGFCRLGLLPHRIGRALRL